jgi:ribosomal protein S1
MKTPRILVRPAAAPAAQDGSPPSRIPGETLEGKITAIEGNDVLIALADGGRAILPTGDFAKFPTVGDRASGFYLIDEPGGAALLTARAPVTEVDPKTVRPGTLVRGGVVEAGRPGVRVRLGSVTGFFPASQLPSGLLREPGKLLRKDLIGFVTEVRGGELILSLRAALDERARRRTVERIASFREGQRVSGVVARKTDFGYFIDLGGVDGLLHISRVERHDEKRRAGGEEALVLAPRQAIEVVVSRVEADRGRIGLDLPEPESATIPSAPSASVAERGSAAAPAIAEVNGILRDLSPGGARVWISEGVEGWLPASRFGGASPRPGELRCFRVLGRDAKTGRLDLSLELRGAIVPEDEG